MEVKVWSPETKFYKLNEEFDLERAEQREFSIYYAIYLNADIGFKASFEQECSVVEEADPYFWIRKNNKRIGGVYIKPNTQEGVFLIPPFTDIYTVLRLLKKFLIQISDRSEDIRAVTILPDQTEYFLRLGFRLGDMGRWMIRPTEAYDIQWDEQVIVDRPKKEEINKMGELFFEAFQNNVGRRKYSLEERISFVDYYFEHNSDNDLLSKASTALYDSTTRELIGICLVSEYNEWPLIYDIAVKPSYSGRGLAQAMLKHALSMLNNSYPAIRLYVQGGNEAEATYYNLGFLPGVMLSSLYIPPLK